MGNSLLTGILWLPAWHVLLAIWGALIPLRPFSFGMGLRRTLLPRVGLGVSEETRDDWQGANCCRFSLRGEKVECERTLMPSLPLLGKAMLF